MKIKRIPDVSVSNVEASTCAGEVKIPAIKPTWRKGISWFLGISLPVALVLLVSQSAKSNDNLGHEDPGLEGSWINTVSPIVPPGVAPITFQTLVTASDGGALIGSDSTKPFASPQHGTWVRIGGHEYAYTFVQNVFDASGTYVGIFKGRSRVRLIGKDEYIGVASVEQRDPDGNIVLARCARLHGVRIVVEHFASPCEGLEASF